MPKRMHAEARAPAKTEGEKEEGEGMREHIFKGKRVDNGEWVEGLFLKGLEDNGLEDGGRISLNIQTWHEGKGGVTSVTYEVIPETVSECSGLKDKNGVGIFEGDIVKDKSFIGVIEYRDNIASFIAKINDSTLECLHWSPLNEGDIDRPANLEYTEVIGNIFDNPELLEYSQ